MFYVCNSVHTNSSLMRACSMPRRRQNRSVTLNHAAKVRQLFHCHKKALGSNIVTKK